MADDRIVEKMGKALDFNGVFFLQLNRIMRSMALGDGSHTNAIEGLEGLCSPYIDKIYNEEMEAISERFSGDKKQLARIKNKQMSKLTDSDMNMLLFNVTKAKFASLMRLAARRRFLPELGIEDEIG